MVRICVLCGNKSTPQTPLFRFPSNLSRRMKWIEFCSLKPDQVNESTALCINHFESDHKISNRLKLNATAIPTLLRDNVKSWSLKRSRTCFICHKNDKNRSYFEFPKDPQQRKVWLLACGIGSLGDSSEVVELDCRKYVCSAHFSDDDVIAKRSENGRTRLRKNAIPKKNVVTVDPNLTITVQQLSDPKVEDVERDCLAIVCETNDITQQNLSGSEVEDVECDFPAMFCETIDVLPANLPADLCTTEPELNRSENENILPSTSIEDIDEFAELLRQMHTECSICQQLIDHLRAHFNPESVPNNCINESNTADHDDEAPVNNESIRSIHNDNEVTIISNSITQETPPKLYPSRKRRFTYIGDISTPDFDTPKRARRSFKLAKNEVIKCRKKIDVMSKRLKRRDMKLDNYKNLIVHLRNKALLSEDASLALLVSKYS